MSLGKTICIRRVISLLSNCPRKWKRFYGARHLWQYKTLEYAEYGGEWLDQLRIDKAGNYRLALAICYNGVQEAMAGRGDWETLTPYIEIVVDNWRPT